MGTPSAAQAVTIGIPTYNRADKLAGALASAIGQQRASVQVVVADNASDDHTGEVCAEYARSHSNVEVIRHRENVGAAANFMSVLDHAQTKYFMWLADDDWIDPGYIAACVDCLESHPDVVLAYGVARYYKGDSFVFSGSQGELCAESPLRRLFRYFLTVEDNAAFYGVYRREALAGVKFGEGFAADWLLVSQVLAQGKAKQVLTALIHRRLGGASASTLQLAKQNEKTGLAKEFPFLAAGVRLVRMLLKEPAFTLNLSLTTRLVAMPLLFLCLLVRGAMDTTGHLLQATSKRFPRTADFVKQKIAAKRQSSR